MGRGRGGVVDRGRFVEGDQVSTNTRDNRLVLVGLLLLCGYLVYDRQQLHRQLAKQAPAVVDGLDDVAAPITEALTKSKAADLARFYRALEDVLERDRDVIKSTGVFRTGHGRALSLAFQETATAGEPKVGHLVDAVFFEALGNQDTELDDTKKTQLLEAVRAVTRACEAVR